MANWSWVNPAAWIRAVRGARPSSAAGAEAGTAAHTAGVKAREAAQAAGLDINSPQVQQGIAQGLTAAALAPKQGFFARNPVLTGVLGLGGGSLFSHLTGFFTFHSGIEGQSAQNWSHSIQYQGIYDLPQNQIRGSDGQLRRRTPQEMLSALTGQGGPQSNIFATPRPPYFTILGLPVGGGGEPEIISGDSRKEFLAYVRSEIQSETEIQNRIDATQRARSSETTADQTIAQAWVQRLGWAWEVVKPLAVGALLFFGGRAAVNWASRRPELAGTPGLDTAREFFNNPVASVSGMLGASEAPAQPAAQPGTGGPANTNQQLPGRGAARSAMGNIGQTPDTGSDQPRPTQLAQGAARPLPAPALAAP